MAYSFRKGAVVTYTREDGGPGPGLTATYPAPDWKVSFQDEGCVEIVHYLRDQTGAMSGADTTVIGWHRIWQVSTVG